MSASAEPEPLVMALASLNAKDLILALLVLTTHGRKVRVPTCTGTTYRMVFVRTDAQVLKVAPWRESTLTFTGEDYLLELEPDRGVGRTPLDALHPIAQRIDAALEQTMAFAEKLQDPKDIVLAISRDVSINLHSQMADVVVHWGVAYLGQGKRFPKAQP